MCIKVNFNSQQIHIEVYHTGSTLHRQFTGIIKETMITINSTVAQSRQSCSIVKEENLRRLEQKKLVQN